MLYSSLHLVGEDAREGNGKLHPWVRNGQSSLYHFTPSEWLRSPGPRPPALCPDCHPSEGWVEYLEASPRILLAWCPISIMAAGQSIHTGFDKLSSVLTCCFDSTAGHTWKTSQDPQMLSCDVEGVRTLWGSPGPTGEGAHHFPGLCFLNITHDHREQGQEGAPAQIVRALPPSFALERWQMHGACIPLVNDIPFSGAVLCSLEMILPKTQTLGFQIPHISLDQRLFLQGLILRHGWQIWSLTWSPAPEYRPIHQCSPEANLLSSGHPTKCGLTKANAGEFLPLVTEIQFLVK